jgi:hypothetical protein
MIQSTFSAKPAAPSIRTTREVKGQCGEDERQVQYCREARMNTRTEHSRPTRALVGVAVAILATASALIAIGRLGEPAEAVELPPVAHQMQAFRNPPIADALLPEVVQDAQNNLNRTGPGAVMRGQTRILASGLGTNRVGVYAVPTTGGAVCYVVSEATYGLSCVDLFERRTGNVQWMHYSGPGVSQTVTGIATDAVTDVKVVVNGVPHDAILRRNAFFWQAGAGVRREDIEALLVRQADGDVIERDLNPAR